jgi:hypothetical protein
MHTMQQVLSRKQPCYHLKIFKPRLLQHQLTFVHGSLFTVVSGVRLFDVLLASIDSQLIGAFRRLEAQFGLPPQRQPAIPV